MDYEQIARQVRALTEDCPYEISNLANTAALLWQEVPKINWVGFYEYGCGELILGPFQGKTACTRIAMGKGVCGTAAAQKKIQRIADVHRFPGHIACDCQSKSEIVIPLYKGGNLWGVLDLDSPLKDRFSQADEEGLQKVCWEVEKFLEKRTPFSELSTY